MNDEASVCCAASVSMLAQTHSVSSAANTSLRTLNLSSNNIGDQGAVVLAEALKVSMAEARQSEWAASGQETAIVYIYNKKLFKIYTYSPQLNTTLEKLELNGNAIDENGGAAIAEALKANSALKALSIRCECAHKEQEVFPARACVKLAAICTVTILPWVLGFDGDPPETDTRCPIYVQ